MKMGRRGAMLAALLFSSLVSHAPSAPPHTAAIITQPHLLRGLRQRGNPGAAPRTGHALGWTLTAPSHTQPGGICPTPGCATPNDGCIRKLRGGAGEGEDEELQSAEKREEEEGRQDGGGVRDEQSSYVPEMMQHLSVSA